jgi:hypothetical protein
MDRQLPSRPAEILGQTRTQGTARLAKCALLVATSGAPDRDRARDGIRLRICGRTPSESILLASAAARPEAESPIATNRTRVGLTDVPLPTSCSTTAANADLTNRLPPSGPCRLGPDAAACS